MITIEGIKDDFRKPHKKKSKKSNKTHFLKNDLTDFSEEVFEISDISKYFGDIKNISATKFLKDIQKLYLMRNKNIHKLKI